MAPFGPAPAMVGNEISWSAPVSRRKLSSAATASISVSLPDGASLSNQARKRDTAMPSRLWAARLPTISARFFVAFKDAIGSAPRCGLPPCSASRRVKASEALAWSRRKVLSLKLSRSRARSSGAHIGEFFQGVTDSVAELGRFNVEGRPAFLRDDRECKRQRRVRHVAATDVESPRNVLGIRDQQGVSAQFLQLSTDTFKFAGRGFASERDFAQRYCADRGCRPVSPKRVDRVGVDGHQFRARDSAGLSQF